MKTVSPHDNSTQSLTAKDDISATTPPPQKFPPLSQPSAAVALADEIKLKFLENQTLRTPRDGRPLTNNDTDDVVHPIIKNSHYFDLEQQQQGTASFGTVSKEDEINLSFQLQVAEPTTRRGTFMNRTNMTPNNIPPIRKTQKGYSRWNYAKKFDLKNVGLGLGALRTSNGTPACMSVSKEPTLDDDEVVSSEGPSLEELEHSVRKRRRNSCWSFVRSSTAALLVFLVYLITLETLLSCAFTIALTMFWYHQYTLGSTSSWNGSGMDWVVLGFAVVTPITVSIGLAFRRREFALYEIRRVRTCAFQIYLSHSIWNWDKGTGRDKAASYVRPPSNDSREEEAPIDWLDHTDQVLYHLIAIGDELCRFLTLPTSSRSSHRMLKSGRREAAEIVQVAYRLFDSLYTQRIIQLARLTEKLKERGLSPSEASRIRQYERYIGEAVEGLRAYKMYRTPQALRAFGRIFTVILPPFYAPTFAQLGFDLHSLTMGILFAAITPLCLTALFESTQAIEDPFVGFITLDGIDVKEEFEVLHWHQMMNARNTIYPHAPVFEKTCSEAIDSYRHMNHDENHIFAMDSSKSLRNGSSSRESFKGGNNGGSGGGYIRPTMDSSSRVSHFAAELMGGGTEHKSLRSRSERNPST